MVRTLSHRSPLIDGRNAVEVALRYAGLPLVRFDEQALLDKAYRQTGLSDFGDNSFREPPESFWRRRKQKHN